MLRDAACGGEAGACSTSVSCQTDASDIGCEAAASSGSRRLPQHHGTLSSFALPPSVAASIVHRILIRSQPLHSSCSSSSRPLPKPVCTHYSSRCPASWHSAMPPCHTLLSAELAGEGRLRLKAAAGHEREDAAGAARDCGGCNDVSSSMMCFRSTL